MKGGCDVYITISIVIKHFLDMNWDIPIINYAKNKVNYKKLF